MWYCWIERATQSRRRGEGSLAAPVLAVVWWGEQKSYDGGCGVAGYPHGDAIPGAKLGRFAEVRCAVFITMSPWYHEIVPQCDVNMVSWWYHVPR